MSCTTSLIPLTAEWENEAHMKNRPHWPPLAHKKTRVSLAVPEFGPLRDWAGRDPSRLSGQLKVEL